MTFRNFKYFIKTRPPLVVFMICLGSFAVVLMSLACAVSVLDIKNPDARRDWNTFLERFSANDLCFSSNQSTASDERSYPLNSDRMDIARVTTVMDTKRVSVGVMLRYFASKQVAVSAKPVRVIGSINGRQLGLRGVLARTLVNVSIALPDRMLKKSKCAIENSACKPALIPACVYFTAFRDVFPTTKEPESCAEPKHQAKHQTMYMQTVFASSLFRRYRCRNMATLRVNHRKDPSLTAMLTQNEKEVSMSHLMNTSYVLLMVLVAFFIYAFVHEPRISYFPVSQSEFDDTVIDKSVEMALQGPMRRRSEN